MFLDKNNNPNQLILAEVTRLNNDIEETKPFDFQDYRDSQLDSIEEYWDEKLSLSQNFINLVNECMVLPYASIQLPIVTAYALIPSAMASVVPVLFCWGSRGSGKSTLGILIAGMHNSEVILASTSFAGVRNRFNKMRWGNSDRCEIEKNCCLVFDNVNRETFNNEQLYTMFLSGYNRRTDMISISQGNGENINFKVFGLKVINSIHPLFTQSRFTEINRRCLIIKFKPIEEMTEAEKTTTNNLTSINIKNKLDLENLDLSPLHKAFKSFWYDPRNLNEYVAIRRSLTSRNKKFIIPGIIDSNRWTIAIDLLTTGLVTGVWSDIQIAINALANYWDWHANNLNNSFGITHKILKDFISLEIESIKKANKQFNTELIPENEINPEKIKKHINYCSSQGMLEITPTPNLIAETMADLGWTLDKGKLGQVCWTLTLK